MSFWKYCRVGLHPEKQEIFFGWPGITAPVICAIVRSLEECCPSLKIWQNSPVTITSPLLSDSPIFIVGWYLQLELDVSDWNQVLHVIAKRCQEHGLSYEVYDSRILGE